MCRWARAGSGARAPGLRPGRAVHAKPRTGTKEELSPLELLHRENELLRETISGADSAFGELEGRLQVGGTLSQPMVKPTGLQRR